MDVEVRSTRPICGSDGRLDGGSDDSASYFFSPKIRVKSTGLEYTAGAWSNGWIQACA
jgi:hypothetical protein